MWLHTTRFCKVDSVTRGGVKINPHPPSCFFCGLDLSVAFHAMSEIYVQYVVCIFLGKITAAVL